MNRRELFEAEYAARCDLPVEEVRAMRIRNIYSQASMNTKMRWFNAGWDQRAVALGVADRDPSQVVCSACDTLSTFIPHSDLTCPMARVCGNCGVVFPVVKS
jgi:hypothetical protein